MFNIGFAIVFIIDSSWNLAYMISISYVTILALPASFIMILGTIQYVLLGSINPISLFNGSLLEERYSK
jgi:hypothetical protein